MFAFETLSLRIFRRSREAALAVSPGVLLPGVVCSEHLLKAATCQTDSPALLQQRWLQGHGTSVQRDPGHLFSGARLYSIGMVSFPRWRVGKMSLPSTSSQRVSIYRVVQKVGVGFPIPSYRKAQMNFLANPRYQVPSRAFVGEPEAKEDRQGFCSFGIILSSFRWWKVL